MEPFSLVTKATGDSRGLLDNDILLGGYRIRLG